jgi:hypothetical protein
VLEQADSQAASVEVVGNQPKPSENLPSAFIDSRPIDAYFDDRLMPDTVRDLLGELKRDDVCGDAGQLRTAEACALVFYKLDDAFTPDRLRPPFIMRAIYRITEPENLADTVILMPDRKGDLQRYMNGRLFEPMRNIRANICLQDERMPDECRGTGIDGVLYRPFGILGNIENDREGILPATSASRHFRLDLNPADAEWQKEQQMRDLCRQRLLVC